MVYQFINHKDNPVYNKTSCQTEELVQTDLCVPAYGTLLTHN